MDSVLYYLAMHSEANNKQKTQALVVRLSYRSFDATSSLRKRFSLEQRINHDMILRLRVAQRTQQFVPPLIDGSLALQTQLWITRENET